MPSSRDHTFEPGDAVVLAISTWGDVNGPFVNGHANSTYATLGGSLGEVLTLDSFGDRTVLQTTWPTRRRQGCFAWRLSHAAATRRED